MLSGEYRALDPYKLLPNMFQDISEKDFAVLSYSDELRDGRAALTIPRNIQFNRNYVTTWCIWKPFVGLAIELVAFLTIVGQKVLVFTRFSVPIMKA